MLNYETAVAILKSKHAYLPPKPSKQFISDLALDHKHVMS